MHLPSVSSLHAPKQRTWEVFTRLAGTPFSLSLRSKACLRAWPVVQRRPSQKMKERSATLSREPSRACSGRGSPFWMWLEKILCTRARSTRSYLTGILPGTVMPTMGSLLQRPVQPVLWMTMSSRPEAWMCFWNSSRASREPAACSQVAEPIWIWILAESPLSARTASAFFLNVSKKAATGFASTGFAMGNSVGTGPGNGGQC